MRKKFLKVKKILKEEGPKKLLILSFRYVRNKTSRLFHPYLEIIFYPYAVAKLKTFKFQDLGSLVDFACNFCFGMIRPNQVKEEIIKLLKILQKHKPKYILEIGTANGGTLFLFTKIASPDAILISVDLPKGHFGEGYSKWRLSLYKSFTKHNQETYLIRDDSHKFATLEKVKTILKGQKLDFLFIDGDHTYEGVKKDFEMYRPLVKKGGIIAFHDIVPGPAQNVGGVPKFWQDTKKDLKSKEIVNDWGQEGWGLGVIFK